METIFPIIVAIIIFAFQAYSNYQKEQEKARKRNPGQPRNANRPVEHPVEEYPSVDSQPSIPVDWEEVYPDARQTKAPAPVSQRHAPTQPLFDDYSGVVDEEEMQRLKRTKARKKQLIPQRLIVQEEDDEDAAWNNEAGFDLRDAVIKSAILERPYQ